MAGKKDLIDDEMKVGLIESELDIEELKMKKNRWTIKMWVDHALKRSFHTYKILLTLNEEPYEQRIEDLEQQLNDSLFAEETTTKASVTKNIKKVRQELKERKKECFDIKFVITLEELKYKDQGTSILARIPDDVIEELNHQKSRYSYYKVILEPVYV